MNENLFYLNNFARSIIVLKQVGFTSINDLAYYLTYLDMIDKNKKIRTSIRTSSSLKENFVSLRKVLNKLDEKHFLEIRDDKIKLSLDGEYFYSYFFENKKEYCLEIIEKLNCVGNVKEECKVIINNYFAKQAKEMFYDN